MKTWVKFYTKTLRDPDMASLDWAQRGIWGALLALAGDLDHRDEDDNETGELDTLSRVAWHIRCDGPDILDAIQSFTELGWIDEREGVLFVTNYGKLQARAPSARRDAVAERVKRHREKKQREANGGVTTLQESVTRRNAPRVRVDTEKKREEAGVPATPPDGPESLPFSNPPDTEPIKITGKPTAKEWKDLRWKLADAFTECSGIKMPLEPDSDAAKRKHYAALSSLWFKPLKDILYRVDWDMPEAKTLLAQAVQGMRRDKLTISNPNSVQKVAVSILARPHASPTDAYMDPDAPMSAEAQAHMERQLREHDDQ